MSPTAAFLFQTVGLQMCPGFVFSKARTCGETDQNGSWMCPGPALSRFPDSHTCSRLWLRSSLTSSWCCDLQSSSKQAGARMRGWGSPGSPSAAAVLPRGLCHPLPGARPSPASELRISSCFEEGKRQPAGLFVSSTLRIITSLLPWC